MESALVLLTVALILVAIWSLTRGELTWQDEVQRTLMCWHEPDEVDAEAVDSEVGGVVDGCGFIGDLF